MDDLSLDPRTRDAYARADISIPARGRAAARLLKALPPAPAGHVLRLDSAELATSAYTIALTATHVITAGAGWTDAAQTYSASALKSIEVTSPHRLQLVFRVFGMRHVYSQVRETPDLLSAYHHFSGGRAALARPTRSPAPPRTRALDAAAPRVAPASQMLPPALTWQDAELLAAAHMGGLGFAGARLTRAGADGGIDVEAPAAVAQVKHYLSPVGPRPVRELAGVARGRTALFYCWTGYTAAAVTAAQDGGVALFTYTSAGQVEGVNAVAHALARRGAAKVDITAVLNEDRDITERASKVMAKARSLTRVRGLSSWRRERVLVKVRAAAELLTPATNRTDLPVAARKRLVGHADVHVQSGARIARVAYRKL